MRSPISLFAFALYGAACIARIIYSVEDPDLGWNLAAGLFILETFSVPGKDPFGAQGNQWICYSWLFEVVVALYYKAGGFRGLQILQSLSGLISIWLCFLYVSTLLKEHKIENEFVSLAIYLVQLYVLIVLFAPIWTLRAHIFSISLFLILLILHARQRVVAKTMLPLAIIWVNVHVFWVLVPVVVFLERVVFARKDDRVSGLLFTVAVTSCGLLNPYFLDHFFELFKIFFGHQAGNQFIAEMKPLVPEMGLSFWVHLLVVLLAVLSFRRVFRLVPRTNLVLFLLCALMAFKTARFLPMSAVASIPILVVGVFPALFSKVFSSRSKSLGKKLSARPFAYVAFVLVAAIVIRGYRQQTISTRKFELFMLAKKVAVELGASERVVFGDFNDGGWLIYSFWKYRAWDRPENHFKVGMDGRTTLAGNQRLEEYEVLRTLAPGWKEIFRRWNVSLVFVRPKAAIVQQLLLMNDGWTATAFGRYWIVLVKDID